MHDEAGEVQLDYRDSHNTGEAGPVVPFGIVAREPIEMLDAVERADAERIIPFERAYLGHAAVAGWRGGGEQE